jgi:hypothetical protein
LGRTSSGLHQDLPLFYDSFFFCLAETGCLAYYIAIIFIYLLGLLGSYDEKEIQTGLSIQDHVKRHNTTCMEKNTGP